MEAMTPQASGLIPIFDYLNAERLRLKRICVKKGIRGHMHLTHTLVGEVVDDNVQYKWGGGSGVEAGSVARASSRTEDSAAMLRGWGRRRGAVWGGSLLWSKPG